MSPATSARRRWLSPAFLTAAAILLVAAVGLNAATKFLQLNFKKDPVPLRADLKTLPKRMGPWLQVSIDRPLNPEVQEVLGTDLYVFRDFVDTRKVTPEEIAQFDGKPIEEQQKLLARLQAEKPEAVLNCAVTYYTGSVDTVPHVPDRCYFADGFASSQYDVPTWTLHLPDGDLKMPVRYITFEDQDPHRGSTPRSVAYFFKVNGHYEQNVLGVRQELQNIFERKAYFAKIELMDIVRDRNVSAAAMADFLSHALPEINKVLPDWQSVRSGNAKSNDAR
jgi:hypothetical protein